jgi:hypothetical protein
MVVTMVAVNVIVPHSSIDMVIAGATTEIVIPVVAIDLIIVIAPMGLYRMGTKELE